MRFEWQEAPRIQLHVNDMAKARVAVTLRLRHLRGEKLTEHELATCCPAELSRLNSTCKFLTYEDDIIILTVNLFQCRYLARAVFYCITPRAYSDISEAFNKKVSVVLRL